MVDGGRADRDRVGSPTRLGGADGELTTPIGTAAVGDHGWHLRLSLLAEPLTEPARRERLQQFFIGLAAASDADYASGEVIAGSIWSGRRLWSNAKTEKPFVSWTTRGGFAGLAPRPVWWSWFGPG